MASSLSGPAAKEFALGLFDGSRAHAMSIVTVLRFALVVVFVLGFGCGDSERGLARACSDRPVRMGVASSLREVALSLRQELLARSEPIDVEMIFGASSVLARQLSLGAPMDVLVSADAEIVKDLIRRGRLVPDSAFEFARGRLVLTARKDWKPERSGIEALASSNLARIAIPSAAVPLGRYARDWLAGQGLLEGLRGRIVTTEHARATLSAVDAGHVDLAIVYASDARLAHRAVVLAEIDPSRHPPIRYVAARVVAGPACPAIDEALSAWSGPVAIEELERGGFRPTPSTDDG